MENKGEFREFIEKIREKNRPLAEELEKIYQLSLEIFSGSKIECPICGKKSEARLWVFIRDEELSYERSEGEPRLKSAEDEMCRLACPECGGEISLYHHPQKYAILDAIEMFSAEDLFKEIIKRKKPRL